MPPDDAFVTSLSREDRAAVVVAMLVAAILIGQQVAGRALRDALFLSAYSVTSLPGMMLASATVGVCGSLVFAGAMARRPPLAVLNGALALSALLFAVEWFASAGRPRLVAAILYVQLALLGGGIVSSFWSLVNERFDSRTASRRVWAKRVSPTTGRCDSGSATVATRADAGSRPPRRRRGRYV